MTSNNLQEWTVKSWAEGKKTSVVHDAMQTTQQSCLHTQRPCIIFGAASSAEWIIIIEIILRGAKSIILWNVRVRRFKLKACFALTGQQANIFKGSRCHVQVKLTRSCAWQHVCRFDSAQTHYSVFEKKKLQKLRGARQRQKASWAWCLVINQTFSLPLRTGNAWKLLTSTIAPHHCSIFDSNTVIPLANSLLVAMINCYTTMTFYPLSSALTPYPRTRVEFLVTSVIALIQRWANVLQWVPHSSLITQRRAKLNFFP